MEKLIGPSKIPFSLNRDIKHENLYFEGFFEKEEKYYVDILSQYDNPISFDVGSNIGYFSCLFKSAGSSQVHSFEPIEEPYQKSIDNLGDLVNSGITLNKVALYDKIMKAKKIYLSVLHNQGSTISQKILKKFKSVFKTDENSINHTYVQTTTLDNYCWTNNIRKIHLLKIDTEGTEYEILKGAKKVLENGYIDNIVYESYDPASIEKLLLSYGYNIKSIDCTQIPMFHAKR